jgi:hypothetical protein
VTELELRKVSGERRLYALGNLGTLRLEGLASRSATAVADGSRWQIGRRGFWKTLVRAVDAGSGETVGEFTPNSLRRGGALVWSGRELTLRASSSWRERYALADGDDELATLEGKSWGKAPVKVTIEDLPASDAGLLLFAAFVVRGLAEDAAGAAAGASTAAVSSTG